MRIFNFDTGSEHVTVTDKGEQLEIQAGRYEDIDDYFTGFADLSREKVEKLRDALSEWLSA